ncbi:hypothetical protein [Ralstonia solanacearum]|uniref:hypothetical protein n=1 Tax=Ralstonia solanacearum TaxID=305 RepID=UPI0006DD059A|nr:hypothetical protein [Ralstonia solanacearum]
MDVHKLRELLEEAHGAQAMVHKDLFALGCWLYLNGKRTAGEKMIKQVVASIPATGNRTYLNAIKENIAGNERAWAEEIFAHLEVNELFQS